jgi:hypothetical protein
MEKTFYSRKISKTEAKNDFIFILKNKLSSFPPIGDNFNIYFSDTIKEARIESYPCTCRGPELPHEHYFIHWNGLKAGDKVEITKKSDKYLLKIE